MTAIEPAPAIARPDEGPLVNKTLRAVLGIGTIAFCMATIVYLIWHGKADNSLHASALSWSYTIIIAMLIAFGLGNAIPALINLLPKPK